MIGYYQSVKQFYNGTSRYSGMAPEGPEIPSNERRELWWKLIQEEYQELYNEVWREDMNLEDLAKEIADLIYVCVGLGVASGIDIDAVFDAVHRSNMLKLPAQYREDGKVLKGPNYRPPNIKEVLDKMRFGNE